MAILADVAPYSREYQVFSSCLAQNPSHARRKPAPLPPLTSSPTGPPTGSHTSLHTLATHLATSLPADLSASLFHAPNPVMIMAMIPVLVLVVNYLCFGPTSKVSVFLSEGRDIPRVPKILWDF